MLFDLNIVLGEESARPLLDLNQELANDGEDEIQHLQEDQFHIIKEAEVQPLQCQSHYLHKEQDSVVQAIDLNVPTSEGQEEESHEDNISFNEILCSTLLQFLLLRKPIHKMEISTLMVHMNKIFLTSI